MIPRRMSLGAGALAVLTLMICTAGCADDGSPLPSSSTPATDAAESDGVDVATEAADDAETEAAGGESTAAAAEPATAASAPAEPIIDVSTAPGSGDFVGALEDVHGLVCSGDDGVWTAAGTVVNPTADVVDYRIYVSFLDAGGETVGLIETNADGVAGGAEQPWSAAVEWPAGELRCVLRVERVEP
jgi:hypothetical protein